MNEKTPFEAATERLHSIEKLLLQPTPQAIFDAGALLEEVVSLVSECGQCAEKGSLEASIGNFRVLCARVTKLLEGARRVQWIRMRLITSLSETYTARAEKKIYSLPRTTVNVRM